MDQHSSLNAATLPHTASIYINGKLCKYVGRPLVVLICSHKNNEHVWEEKSNFAPPAPRSVAKQEIEHLVHAHELVRESAKSPDYVCGCILDFSDNSGCYDLPNVLLEIRKKFGDHFQNLHRVMWKPK